MKRAEFLLGQHISTKFNSAQTSLLQEMLATLENLEAFTLKHLRKCVAKLSKVSKPKNDRLGCLILSII